MAKEKRNRGTSPGHPLRFTEETILALPEHILPAELARLLGVSRAALSKWMRRGGLPGWPCKRRDYGGSYMIFRSEFLEWARATGRYDGPVMGTSNEKDGIHVPA